jgi:hypothetical protein
VLYFKSTGFNTLARPSRLWALVLSSDGRAAKLGHEPVNLLNQTAAWEAKDGRGCIEAPALYAPPRGDSYILFYSGGDWTAGMDGTSPVYAIGYASCVTALGPCQKRTVSL